MLKFISVGFAVLLLVSPVAGADTIKGAYVGCLTKESLDEFIGAAVNKDQRQMQSLLNRQCFSIEGREYSVVKAGFVKSQIRVYAGDGSVLLWVPAEAAR